MASIEYHHGAPTELKHPGKPAGSGGSKGRWGTDIPLPEDVLRKLDPAFLATKALLEGSWKFIGFFGLTLFIIGPYYTIRVIRRIGGGDEDHWCNPGEESNLPITDSYGMIWAVLVIATFLMYVSAIIGFIAIIAFMGSCLNVVEKIFGLITNPLGTIEQFKACGSVILNGVGK